MANLGPNLGLEEEILSGCCLHFTGTKKKQQKDSAGFAFIPPSVKQAGHMWGEEEGGELLKLWVVVFKHLSWSCVASVHPFNGLHSCP